MDMIFLVQMKVGWDASDEEKLRVIRFCKDVGVIASSYECHVCLASMNLIKNSGTKDVYGWNCCGSCWNCEEAEGGAEGEGEPGQQHEGHE